MAGIFPLLSLYTYNTCIVHFGTRQATCKHFLVVYVKKSCPIYIFFPFCILLLELLSVYIVILSMIFQKNDIIIYTLPSEICLI